MVYPTLTNWSITTGDGVLFFCLCWEKWGIREAHSLPPRIGLSYTLSSQNTDFGRGERLPNDGGCPSLAVAGLLG